MAILNPDSLSYKILVTFHTGNIVTTTTDEPSGNVASGRDDLCGCQDMLFTNCDRILENLPSGLGLALTLVGFG